MTSPLTTTTELYLGGAWVDVSEHVRVEPGIGIKRGRQDEQGAPSPAVCTLNFNNRSGDFSMRNPLGAYYGQLTRNTPLRVSVDIDGSTSTRGVFEVPEWPVEWVASESDVWVRIVASGIRRRLSQGKGRKPVLAPLRRAILAAAGLQAYWPMDDPEGSLQFASALAPVAALEPVAGFDLRADTTHFPQLPAALPIAALGSTAALVPSFGTVVQGRFFAYIPSGLGSSPVALASVLMTGGSIGTIECSMVPNVGQLACQIFGPTGAFLVGGSTGITASALDKPLMINFSARQNGTAVDLRIDVCNIDGTQLETLTASRAATTLGTAYAATIGAGGPGVQNRYALDDVTIGHFYLQSQLTSTDEVGPAVLAYAGELAEERIERLCAEQGVPFTLIGTNVGASSPLGPQPNATFLAIIDEAAAVDGGILTEARDSLGLTYRPRVDLFNALPTATLHYEERQLADLRPTDDDQGIVNDLTLTRRDGSSVRFQLTEGALSVNDPPAGVGLYDDAQEINVYSDDQLRDQASWRVHAATVDEPRYPAASFDLLRATDPFDATELDELLAMNEGDTYAITGPPGFAGAPDTAYETLIGYSEQIGSHTYDVTFVGRSANPHFQVGRYNDDGDYLIEEPGSRYSSSGTTTNEALDATETAIDITTPNGAKWTNDPAMFPFDIRIGGERITVGGCTGTGANQTFTGCTRSVNGVVKSHALGAVVELWQPARYGFEG